MSKRCSCSCKMDLILVFAKWVGPVLTLCKRESYSTKYSFLTLNISKFFWCVLISFFWSSYILFLYLSFNSFNIILGKLPNNLNVTKKHAPTGWRLQPKITWSLGIVSCNRRLHGHKWPLERGYYIYYLFDLVIG